MSAMYPSLEDMKVDHMAQVGDACFVVRGGAKLKKIQKSKINLDRTHPTHPPTPVQTFVWQPITDMDRTFKS